MTAGERRFAQRLRDKLEEDYFCWYNLPVGRQQHKPDFVILNPRRGLLILEVKDWKLASIQRITKDEVILNVDYGQTPTRNPLRQAESYVQALVNELQREPLLRFDTGATKPGALAVPYAAGVVFANITRAEIEATDISAVIPAHRLICKDEFTESVEAEAFQERFWQMFPFTPRQPLTLPQINRIRALLYPEIRVSVPDTAQPNPPTDSEPGSRLAHVMDLQQEQWARSLRDGHRVIYGVAGSGKTMLLAYRCVQLAGEADKPVLVLCYNVALAAKLSAHIQEKADPRKIHVRHFHAWCDEQLRLYHVARLAYGPDYPERLVQHVVHAVDSGLIPAGQYSAILVDEAHDFEATWLRLVVAMVDPTTESLLILYDGAQAIYKRKGGFSFASVGIKARGRTTVLRINYRNTAEILRFAYDFARDAMTAGDEDIPLVEPETAGRHGSPPCLSAHRGLTDELNQIVTTLHALHEAGMPWQNVAILYRYRKMAEWLMPALQRAGIPVEWLQQSKGSRYFRPHHASIKLLTMHSSKGLEFPVVFIPGAGAIPNPDCDLNAEIQLLYVAMTRATEQLFLSYHRASAITARLTRAAERLAA